MSDNMQYTDVLAMLKTGRAILFSSSPEGYDLPTIHQVGHILKTDTEVIHLGWGMFEAKVQGEAINFDAGGAMYDIFNADGKRVNSCSRLRATPAQLAYMGYNVDATIATVEAIIAA